MFYFNFKMDLEEKSDVSKQPLPIRLTAWQRLLAGSILPLVGIIFAILHFAAVHKWVFYPWPCGFKTRFGLPCPSCGMTTAVLAFARGEILRSFYIQPAAAAFCCIFILTSLFCMSAAIAGTDWGIIRNIKLKHLIVTFILMTVGGWAVTIARALAAG